MNLNDYLIGYFLEAHMTALINNDFTGLDYENPRRSRNSTGIHATQCDL